MGEYKLNLTAFQFERMLDDNKLREYLADSWWPLSLWFSAVYVIVIFAGKWIMERKERFGLNIALAWWSGMLAVFSILGTLRVWPEIVHVLRYESFYSSVCKTGWLQNEVTKFWTALFMLSKVIELGDTVFIVLRKQPLIFLHWYHHVSVLVYTWYSYIEQTASGRWFMGMNFAVHSVMYTYYALRALRYRVPDGVRMFITVLQLIQMVVGCGLGFYVFNLKSHGQYCGITDKNLYYSFLMYFSYFVLFAKFFYDTYVNPVQRLPQTQKSKSQNGSAAGDAIIESKKLE